MHIKDYTVVSLHLEDVKVCLSKSQYNPEALETTVYRLFLSNTTKSLLQCIEEIEYFQTGFITWLFLT